MLWRAIQNQHHRRHRHLLIITSSSLPPSFWCRCHLYPLFPSVMTVIITPEKKRRLIVVFAVVLLCHYHNSIRERSFLTREAILLPSVSPWRQLMDYTDDSSFLHMTGLTRFAFNELLHILIPPDDSLHQRKKGRQWSLPPDGHLGLLLYFWVAKWSVSFSVHCWALHPLCVRG